METETELEMAMDLKFGLMVLDMKDIGKTTKPTDKAS